MHKAKMVKNSFWKRFFYVLLLKLIELFLAKHIGELIIPGLKTF